MEKWVHVYKNQLTVAAFIFIVSGFIFGGNIKSVAFIIATAIASLPIALKAFQALRLKVFSIELLVMIAVVGALFIGEYTESAIVTFLFLFGDFLEGRTLEKTRSSLKKLVEMAPQEAIVMRDGKQLTIDAEDVVLGDRVLVQSGGKIPVDGKIVGGHASVNEATVTGEAVPVQKQINDQVFSGTIIDHGYIELIAEKVGEDTTFAKIIELVEEAQESKSRTEKFINRFATIYTPFIVILSVFVYLLTRDFHLAITFLVIACPGALIIGAPVSNVVGIGNGARNGILVKGGEVVDLFSKVDTIVFDKTGTLTKGKPEVTDIKLFSDENEQEILQQIAQAEMISEHHLGRAIVKEAKNRGLALDQTNVNGEVIKGGGIRARVQQEIFTIGNRKLMGEDGIQITESIEMYALDREREGNTAIFVAKNYRMIAVISIADEVREDAREAIQELRAHGIKEIIMLTGDNTHTAKIVAEKLGLDAYHAELLPEDKVEYVKRLKASGKIVAMAGDGINDAPAIATAHIGVAMGQGGTDVSMETADIVLMADRMKQFSYAYTLSKATMKNMKQNTILAVTTVILLLIGVLNHQVHLASGMFIHEASVLLVILNGMRLMRFNPRKIERRVKDEKREGVLTS